MIKLSQEGILKAERVQKQPLAPNSQVVNAQEKPLKEIKSSIPVNTQTIRKQNRLFFADESFSGLDRRSKKP